MKIDLFVMDTAKRSQERVAVESVAADWWVECSRASTHEFNLTHIQPRSVSAHLDFAREARQKAFTCPGTDIFILTDNDILPFSAKHIDNGLQVLIDNPQFAILSLWPEPHTFRSIELDGREAINNEDILETYSVGAMRFCRKIPSLVAPFDSRKGYDGVFCRHLWKERGMRVGYLKRSRAFHLGSHCTTLWVD